MAEKSCLAFLLLMRTADLPLLDGLTVRGTLSNHPNYVFSRLDTAIELNKKIKSEKVDLNWERSLMGVFIFIRRKWKEREREREREKERAEWRDLES